MISNRAFRALITRAGTLNSLARPTATAQRSFGKKGNRKNRGEASDVEAAMPEPEVATPEPEVAMPEPEVAMPEPEVAMPEPEVAMPEPEVAMPEPEVPAAVEAAAQEVSSFFEITDVPKVQTAPGHKAPAAEDTIEGRYAGVLFSSASQQESLYDVYEDMIYLSELYKASEPFRMYTQNSGVGKKEINALNGVLNETAPFNPLTIHFLTVLAENKRLGQIYDIAMKYKKFYQLFNKEEKITIISAEELTAAQKDDVVEALKANPNNQGKAFTIEYSVDPIIRGGLQMYTESEFMDMSLVSRLTRINEEVAKLSL